MIHVTKQLDGERLEPLRLDGFPDEVVLVVPLGDIVVECAFRVMDRPGHTMREEPNRAATLDEIAEVAHVLAGKSEI